MKSRSPLQQIYDLYESFGMDIQKTNCFEITIGYLAQINLPKLQTMQCHTRKTPESTSQIDMHLGISQDDAKMIEAYLNQLHPGSTILSPTEVQLDGENFRKLTLDFTQLIDSAFIETLRMNVPQLPRCLVDIIGKQRGLYKKTTAEISDDLIVACSKVSEYPDIVKVLENMSSYLHSIQLSKVDHEGFNTIELQVNSAKSLLQKQALLNSDSPPISTFFSAIDAPLTNRNAELNAVYCELFNLRYVNLATNDIFLSDEEKYHRQNSYC